MLVSLRKGPTSAACATAPRPARTDSPPRRTWLDGGCRAAERVEEAAAPSPASAAAMARGSTQPAGERARTSPCLRKRAGSRARPLLQARRRRHRRPPARRPPGLRPEHHKVPPCKRWRGDGRGSPAMPTAAAGTGAGAAVSPRAARVCAAQSGEACGGSAASHSLLRVGFGLGLGLGFGLAKASGVPQPAPQRHVGQHRSASCAGPAAARRRARRRRRARAAGAPPASTAGGRRPTRLPGTGGARGHRGGRRGLRTVERGGRGRGPSSGGGAAREANQRGGRGGAAHSARTVPSPPSAAALGRRHPQRPPFGVVGAAAPAPAPGSVRRCERRMRSREQLRAPRITSSSAVDPVLGTRAPPHARTHATAAEAAAKMARPPRPRGPPRPPPPSKPGGEAGAARPKACHRRCRMTLRRSAGASRRSELTLARKRNDSSYHCAACSPTPVSLALK